MFFVETTDFFYVPVFHSLLSHYVHNETFHMKLIKAFPLVFSNTVSNIFTQISILAKELHILLSAVNILWTHDNVTNVIHDSYRLSSPLKIAIT